MFREKIPVKYGCLNTQHNRKQQTSTQTQLQASSSTSPPHRHNYRPPALPRHHSTNTRQGRNALSQMSRLSSFPVTAFVGEFFSLDMNEGL